MFGPISDVDRSAIQSLFFCRAIIQVSDVVSLARILTHGGSVAIDVQNQILSIHVADFRAEHVFAIFKIFDNQNIFG